MPKLIQSKSSQNLILNLEKEENNIIIKPKKIEELELKEKEKKYNNIEEKEEEIETRLIKINEKEKNLYDKEKKLNDKEKNLIEKEMKLKEKEIKLKKELDDLKKELEKIKKNNAMEENNIIIKIIDWEQKIDFSINCNKNDKFTKIEELFYESYPMYKKRKNIFNINGKDIDRNKTLQENNIQNNQIIVLLNSDS